MATVTEANKDKINKQALTISDPASSMYPSLTVNEKAKPKKRYQYPFAIDTHNNNNHNNNNSNPTKKLKLKIKNKKAKLITTTNANCNTNSTLNNELLTLPSLEPLKHKLPVIIPIKTDEGENINPNNNNNVNNIENASISQLQIDT